MSAPVLETPQGGLRDSDRLVTPRVIVVFLLVGAALVLATIGAVTYLSAIGRDPDPMLKLVAQAVTAVGSLGTLLLTLTGRQGIAKVERNTGLIAKQVTGGDVR
jgi:hypothetical protein